MMRKKLEELKNRQRQKELDKLLESQNKSSVSESKDKGDRTGIYWGLGIAGTLLLITIILARIRQKRKLKR